jgi:hypothetical protein
MAVTCAAIIVTGWLTGKIKKRNRHHGIRPVPRTMTVPTEPLVSYEGEVAIGMDPDTGAAAILNRRSTPNPITAPQAMSSVNVAEYLKAAMVKEAAYLISCGVGPSFVERGMERVFNPRDPLWSDAQVPVDDEPNDGPFDGAQENEGENVANVVQDEQAQQDVEDDPHRTDVTVPLSH